MKWLQRRMWLVAILPAMLLACKTVELPPKRLGENKYEFLVIRKGVMITPREFQFSDMRARALCERDNLEHFVDVEPDTVVENGRELNVFHFTCAPPYVPSEEVW